MREGLGLRIGEFIFLTSPRDSALQHSEIATAGPGSWNIPEALVLIAAAKRKEYKAHCFSSLDCPDSLAEQAALV